MARFDKAYYDRFYRDARTCVQAFEDVDRLCAFVCSYLAHLDVDLRRAIDLGCGLGHWRDALAVHAPRASYVGVEVSEYLCQEFGWRHGSVVDYRGNGAFDLVICQGVLQYLSDADARRAIDNLARLCRGALYLEALTQEDWEENVDRRRTDGEVRLRSARWYRSRLRAHFVNAGGGVFVKREAGTVLFALERAE